MTANMIPAEERTARGAGIGSVCFDSFNIHGFGGPWGELWTLCQLSHLIDLPLDGFVPFFHYINKVGIHEVDEKINAKNGDDSRQKDAHEFVLLKGRRS